MAMQSSSIRIGIPSARTIMLASVTFLGSSAVRRHLSINYVRHVAPLTEELHHLLASPCHLRPPGFGFRVLLQPTNLVAFEDKIHLPQSSFGGSPDGVTLFP